MRLFWYNVKLVWGDMQEDWALSKRTFLRWQVMKVRDGLRFGLWPWKEPM